MEMKKEKTKTRSLHELSNIILVTGWTCSCDRLFYVGLFGTCHRKRQVVTGSVTNLNAYFNKEICCFWNLSQQ